MESALSIWRRPTLTPYFAVSLHDTYSYKEIETTGVTCSALALCWVSAWQRMILGNRVQVIPVTSQMKDGERYVLVAGLLQIKEEKYRRQDWWHFASERSQFSHAFIEPWHSEFAFECII
jgi:hypothetical protein